MGNIIDIKELRAKAKKDSGVVAEVAKPKSKITAAALRDITNRQKDSGVVAEVAKPKSKLTAAALRDLTKPQKVTATPEHVYLNIKETTKAIRKALKENFPNAGFSATIGKGRRTTNVSWTDGPTENMVLKVVKQFRGAEFNGMDDSYTYLTHEVDGKIIHYSGWSSLNRRYSPEFQRNFSKAFNARHQWKRDCEGANDYSHPYCDTWYREQSESLSDGAGNYLGVVKVKNVWGNE